MTPPLTITQDMIERLLGDPVMAAKVIMGYTLDAFQACRLREYWFIPHNYDSSGVSTGKTIDDWIYANLRCLLMPGHRAVVYFPTFDNGKRTFWEYYGSCTAPIFRAQLGRTETESEKNAVSQGAACFKAFYRNGSELWMPAASFVQNAKTQASLRVNTLVVEEVTQVDASSDGINKILISRATRPCYNKHHPVMGNHIHFSAHAETMMHPGYKRFREHEREVDRGNPKYAVTTYCHKDYSNLRCHTGKTFKEEYRFDDIMDHLIKTKSRSEVLGEVYGIWAKSGKGWFTEEAILNCVALGANRGLKPVTSRRQDEGVLS